MLPRGLLRQLPQQAHVEQAVAPSDRQDLVATTRYLALSP